MLCFNFRMVQFNHYYISIFMREDQFRKWVGVVDLLTQLTAYMFFLALVRIIILYFLDFYNIEIPACF